MPPATLHADSFGNPLTLDDAASLPLVEDFAMGFVSTEARAVNLLALADSDASPMVQAYCATLHLFAESRDAAANARPFLAKARAAAERATPRERRYIAAIEAWAEGDVAKAIALHTEQARDHPRPARQAGATRDLAVAGDLATGNRSYRGQEFIGGRLCRHGGSG